MNRLILFIFLGGLGGLTSGLYAAPLAPEEAPWPLFRRDQQNTGFSPIPKQTREGAKPYLFATGKGIFASPVIDARERVYIGSADRSFYILSPKGEVVYQFETEEIIDSAAMLTTQNGEAFVTLPAGDGHLYHFSMGPGREELPRLVWSFDSKDHPHPAQTGYSWFEGHVTVGPKGHIYAGNTNFNFYSLTSKGELRWIFPAKNMNWSIASFDSSGHLYFSSLDRSIRKLEPEQGELVWSFQTRGFNAGSVALIQDDLALASSFDGGLYGLDPRSGKRLFTYRRPRHIYASPAVSPHPHEWAIYITAADGTLTRLNEKGEVIWVFETQSPIRSSPSVHKDGEGRDIVYFGAADGRLYAVNGDGSLRYRFDTSEDRVRNDLNSSPALGRYGVAIGGEHGKLLYLPYDYPLRHPEDERVELSLPPKKDGVSIQRYTPGLSPAEGDEMPANGNVILKLTHIKDQKEQFSRFAARQTKVSFEPELAFKLEANGLGDTLYVIPTAPMEPETTYTLTLSGQALGEGFRLGPIQVGRSQNTPIEKTLSFQTLGPRQPGFDWQPSSEQTLSFELYRLSFPSPTMLPSLNQIGFDSLHWLVSILAAEEDEGKPGTGRLLALLQEAVWVDGKAELKPKPRLIIPLTGSYQGSQYQLSGENVRVEVAGIELALQTFILKGELDSELNQVGTPSLYVEANPLADRRYALLLLASGMVNRNWVIPAFGTTHTRAYEGDSHRVPEGALGDFEKITSGLRTHTYRWQPGRKGEGSPFLLVKGRAGYQVIRAEGEGTFQVSRSLKPEFLVFGQFGVKLSGI